MRSVMQHRFSEVPSIDIPRSTFDRSHGYKTTFDGGNLIPIFTDIAYPADTMRINMTGFARLSTPIYPIMDNMFMETFFFAVPIRLIWSNFPKFMGQQTDPGDSIDYTIPIIDDLQNPSNETIWDYFGLPTLVNAIYDFNAWFPRAYNLIFNEWFRDQNLQDSLTVNTDDGPDTEADYEIVKRCKRHDYFTSCLPWLQKGDAVQMALGDTAPITGVGVVNSTFAEAGQTALETDGSGASTYANSLNVDPASANSQVRFEEDPSNSGFPNVRADLANAIGPTINELRQAVQVQRLLEKDARAGTRYIEIIKSHFGVNSQDSRLQRPEYLGGGSSPVIVSPIPRTDSSPGELGAFGISTLRGHGFTKSFTEHCLVIGLVNVRADLTYQEGIDRHWSDQTRYDMLWPVLTRLGEQAVLNKEIYVDAADIGSGAIDDVFGYQERYAHLRYKKSLITGKFRSNDPASLDAWHLGIEYGGTPTLDDVFIEDNPPIDRVIATPTEPHFIFDSYFNYLHSRPMPIFSVPGLIDHF